MSHFTIGVVLPKDTELNQECVEEAVRRLMAPYDENQKVDPYQRECHCKGRVLKNVAFELARSKVGPNPYQTVPEDEWQKWHDAFVKVMDDYIDAHPEDNTFDPDCQSCNGTGFYESQYNPKSKWDWWRIGGRWCGSLTQIEPPDDGKGGFNFEDKYEAWNWNTVRLGELLERTELYKFFALLTPEGEWFEEAKMGWWAITTNDKNEKDWEAIQRAVYTKYAEHNIVLVDAHI